MKIIVTGCKGQLGAEIMKQLREGRSEIGPIPEKLLNATVIAADLPELDISNYKMVDDFIRRQRPDVIINCAAYTNVDGCEVNHDAAFKANAIGPRNLAQAAEKTGARLTAGTASECAIAVCLPSASKVATLRCRFIFSTAASRQVSSARKISVSFTPARVSCDKNTTK